MAREQLRYAFIDLVESIRERVARSRADDAAFDKRDGPLAVSLYDAVAGRRSAWVDAENDQRGEGSRVRVEGRGSGARVEGRGSRVEGRGSRVEVGNEEREAALL